jgi:hypothetical protein
VCDDVLKCPVVDSILFITRINSGLILKIPTLNTKNIYSQVHYCHIYVKPRLVLIAYSFIVFLHILFVPFLSVYIRYIYIYTRAGIAQSVSDSLRAGRSGDRIPVGARFSAHVQTGPGAQPASYTMGTGSFPGVKRPGRGVDHPPHLAPWF